MKIYEKFHYFLLETLFSNKKKGEFVYLIVDEQLIINASNILNVSKEAIIKDISDLYYYDRYYNYSIAAITSIIAIQLYAVSQCESKSDDYTANAYRPIIEKILNIDKLNIDKWMAKHQDDVWQKFYQWCDKQSFLIEKHTPRTGKGRYVQYPLEQAKYTFNQDDLKYFGYIFKEHDLLPDEDISFKDFWRLLHISEFKRNNHHECKIIKNISEKSGVESAKSQIYSFYNIWDGSYISPNNTSKQNKKGNIKNDYTLHLSLRNAEIKVDIRNSLYEKIDQLSLSEDFYNKLIKYYRFKQKNIIVFQPNNDYENYWDEIRFIENKDYTAIIITIGDKSRSNIHGAKILYSGRDIKVQKITYTNFTQDYYTSSEPFFKLIGGLSIAKNKYIQGGAPILQIQRRSIYWIDGKLYEENEGNVVLNLTIGDHWIKFPNSKRKEIAIVEVETKVTARDEFLYKWNLCKKENIWKPVYDNFGVVGLDFSSYTSYTNDTPLLRRWILAVNGNEVIDHNNLSIKLLNNINRYE